MKKRLAYTHKEDALILAASNVRGMSRKHRAPKRTYEFAKPRKTRVVSVGLPFARPAFFCEDTLALATSAAGYGAPPGRNSSRGSFAE